MEIPFFGSSQPGNAYYFMTMSVYKIGVVSSAESYEREDEPKDHIHCHTYGKGVRGKGSNNVSSLIMKTLTRLNCYVLKVVVGNWTLFLTIVLDKTKTI